MDILRYLLPNFSFLSRMLHANRLLGYTSAFSITLIPFYSDPSSVSYPM